MLKAVFFGTPEIACPSLEALAGWPGANVAAVVSQPDKPRGRALKLEPTPVKTTANRLTLPVLQPSRAREESFLAALRDLQPDLIIVMAYGQILPQALLDIPRHGCLNLHTSILPKYRGAAPIQWAILDGETETGVTLMKMDAGMDTGPMVAVTRTPIGPEDNAETIHDRLALLGAKLLIETLPGYLDGTLAATPQPEGATHARKITKEDGRLHWAEPAEQLFNRIRALTPWPGTFTHWLKPDGRMLLKIWRARPAAGESPDPGRILAAGPDRLLVGCGRDALEVLTIQREGGRRMEIREFLAGHACQAGEQFE